MLKILGNVIKLTNRSSRVKYYHDCLKKFNNDPKKIWNFLNTSLERHSKKDLNVIYDGDLIEIGRTKANILNQYFIQSVACQRLRTQTYPEDSCKSLCTLRQCPFRFNVEIDVL